MDTKIIIGVIVIFFAIIIVSVGFCSCHEHMSQIDPVNPVPPQGKSVVLSDNAGTLESLGIDSLLYLAIPKGGVIMWAGEVSKIPTGWKLCDGNNGQPVNGIIIPDLRGRFVVGVAPGKYDMRASGGNDTHTITVDEMPSHTHQLTNKYGSGGYCANKPCGFQFTDRTWDDSPVNGQFINDPRLNLSSTGNNRAFDMRPSYYALAYIIKV